jgi:t-SNARE complex subunit (syntaxin)
MEPHVTAANNKEIEKDICIKLIIIVVIVIIIVVVDKILLRLNEGSVESFKNYHT